MAILGTANNFNHKLGQAKLKDKSKEKRSLKYRDGLTVPRRSNVLQHGHIQ